MVELVNKIINPLGYKLNRIIKESITPAISEEERLHIEEVYKWKDDNGDKTLRLNYELDENSVVFDLGGYEGQWASDIFSKYLCNVFVFEPYQKYADCIEKRFIKNSKIKVFPIGLAETTKDDYLSVSDDGSSIFKKSQNMVTVKLEKASDFILQHKINKIDLLKINIEGGEYNLLNHIVDSGLIHIIENIQVQFHYFYPNAKLSMDEIQRKLMLTHKTTYQYPFVWENWKRKS
jgi:FkbM family methyltransferase